MLIAEEGQVQDAAARPPQGQGVARGSLAFGEYGLKAMENAWITDRQIEASRVAITPLHQARGASCGSAFSRTSRTPKSPRETRMGKGKGAPEKWVAVVKPGRIMLKWQAWTKPRRAKHWDSHRTSCRFPRNSSPAQEDSEYGAAY